MKILERFKKKKELSEDEILLNELFPKTEFQINESYIKTGEGYITFLELYDIPKQDYFWLTKLNSLENVIVSIHTHKYDIKTAEDDANNSADEYSNRSFFSTKLSKSDEAAENFRNLDFFINRITKQGDKPIFFNIKIMIYARTLEGLENKTLSVLEKLNSNKLKATIKLNEIADDYMNLSHSMNYMVKNSLFGRKGDVSLASSIGKGFPFTFIEHTDERGTLLGYTQSNGVVIFNLFEQAKDRYSFGALVFGVPGSGKSTLLKKLAVNQVAQGDYVYAFDATEGEFNGTAILSDDTKNYRVSLDGTRGIINPFEIFVTRDSLVTSYQRHKANLVTFFCLSTGTDNKSIINTFSSLTHELYIQHGIVKLKGNEIKDEVAENLLQTDTKVVNNDDLKEDQLEEEEKQLEQKANYEVVDLRMLGSRDFPTLDDLYNLTLEKIDKLNRSDDRVSVLMLENYLEIRLALETLINDYGNVFNGHSSLNLTEKDYIIFSTAEIDIFPENIKTAIITNVLNILRAKMYENKKQDGKSIENKEEYKDNQSHVVVILDEAHKIISKSTPLYLLRQFTTIQREARKYMSSLVLSFHNVDDLNPGEERTENQAELENIIKLSQYKFILRQDETSLWYVRKVVGDLMTDEMINKLKSDSQGTCNLVIQGQKTVKFHIHTGYLEEHNMIATGGVGNV